MQVKVCERGKRDVLGPATLRFVQAGNATAVDHNVVEAVLARECHSSQHQGIVPFFDYRPPHGPFRSFGAG
jgi:hypothetical protein